MASTGTKFTISHIENFLSILVTKSGASKNIFVGELPPTTDKSWDDFILVDVGQQKKNGAISTGYANIYLYARPTGTNLKKNVKQLLKMEDALDNAINSSHDDTYIVQELYRDSDYDQNRKFHFNMIGLSIITK